MMNFGTPSSLLSNLRRVGFATLALVALAGCADDTSDDPIASGPAAGERASQPSIAITDVGGKLAAVWSADNQVHYTFSLDDGETWLNPRTIKSPLEHAAHPAIAPRGEGFVVAFIAFEGGQRVAAVTSLIAPALKDTESIVLGGANMVTPHIVPAADGLQIAFETREGLTRYARYGNGGVSVGEAYPAESHWLCGAEDGTVYSVERGSTMRVSRISAEGRQLLASLPILDGFSDDPFTCSVLGDSLFVSVGVSDDPADTSRGNALYAYELDRHSGVAIQPQAIELYRSKQRMLAPRLVTASGNVGAVFFTTAESGLTGDLHYLKILASGQIDDDVVAETELTRSLSYASRQDESFLLYEDGGFVGFMSL